MLRFAPSGHSPSALTSRLGATADCVCFRTTLLENTAPMINHLISLVHPSVFGIYWVSLSPVPLLTNLDVSRLLLPAHALLPWSSCCQPGCRWTRSNKGSFTRGGTSERGAMEWDWSPDSLAAPRWTRPNNTALSNRCGSDHCSIVFDIHGRRMQNLWITMNGS